MKIVCDFGVVSQLGVDVEEIGNTSEYETTNVEGKTDENFTTWVGKASGEFDQLVKEKIAQAKGVNERTIFAGKYIKYCSKSIEDLDEQLAKAKI